MAGTTVNGRRTVSKKDASHLLRLEHNKVVTDLETLRAASRQMVMYHVEDLAAGADIAARAIFKAPMALTVVAASFVHEAASVGVDGSNTAVVTLRNITTSTDMASVTLTATSSANATTSLTISSASAAANDVLGIVVTQGATANLGALNVQFSFQPQTVDAAADMTAAVVNAS